MKRRNLLLGTASWCAACQTVNAQPRNPDTTPIGGRTNGRGSDRERLAPRPRATRCGATWADAGAQGGIRSQAYGLKTFGTRNGIITWKFTGTVTGVPNPIGILVRACSLWMSAAPIVFRETPGAQSVDIAISMSSRLGPNTWGSATSDGRTIQFNSNVAFVPTAAAGTGPSFLNVATHEIGHCLGLLHANSNYSMMWPNANRAEQLTADDVAGVRALYGWPDQRRELYGTEQAPSICRCGTSLVMAWRGAGRDRNIYLGFSSDGKVWSQQRRIEDVATVASPGLAWDGTRLWMVWRGSENDQGLWFKTTTDFFRNDNPPQAPISFAGSSHSPRIAIIRGVPTLVWKGINEDQTVWFSEWGSGPRPFWQGQRAVIGIGTAASPAICEDVDGGIRLMWRGIDGDQKLWTTSAPPGTHAWAPQANVSWFIPGNGIDIPDVTGTAASWTGPSLASWTSAPGTGGTSRRVVHAAWRGIEGDQALYYTQMAKDFIGSVAGPTLGWSSQAVIPRVGSSEAPGLAVLNDRLVLGWKGVESDSAVYTLVN